MDSSHPPTLVVPSRTLVAPPTEDGPGMAREVPSEDVEFYAEDGERAVLIDARGVEIRLVGPNGISIDFPWDDIASISHTLREAGLHCTLFIEFTDDVPYDCALTAPDDVTYGRWARHLPDVLDHYCE
ncbi:hypothetical protein AB0C11_19450 [Streptomyces sp. NPDC039016]|uniref:hypothetical protein n=1 Tax=Streptomyces sp. NPDC039016 TaxID=3154330 RepID=UPI003401261A